MDQQLKVFTAISVDWSSVPIIQVKQLTTNCKPVSRNPTHSSGLSGQPHTHILIRAYTHK